jgi:serine/threonine-protein kinase HipA
MLRKIDDAVSQWRTRGKRLGMSNRELDLFADAFEHPERQAVQRLSARGK